MRFEAECNLQPLYSYATNCSSSHTCVLRISKAATCSHFRMLSCDIIYNPTNVFRAECPGLPVTPNMIDTPPRTPQSHICCYRRSLLYRSGRPRTLGICSLSDPLSRGLAVPLIPPTPDGAASCNTECCDGHVLRSLSPRSSDPRLLESFLLPGAGESPSSASSTIQPAMSSGLHLSMYSLKPLQRARWHVRSTQTAAVPSGCVTTHQHR